MLAAAVIATAVVASLVLVVKADGGVRRVRSAQAAIALTFDDGPDPRYTPAVLDALADAGASATFFVVGEQAARHPQIIARIVAEGHEVAHHTHTHPRLERVSSAQFAWEIEETLRTLVEFGVARPVWYRPPRGYRDAQLEAMAEQRGLRVALWARCFERGEYDSASDMADRMARITREGDIVLAHDGLGDRSMTVEALPRYLAAMRTRGVDVVSLTQLTQGPCD